MLICSFFCLLLTVPHAYVTGLIGVHITVTCINVCL